MFRRRVVTSLAVCVGLASASVVQAQVKLEQKVTENQTRTHKTQSKTHQILSIAGQDVETSAEQTIFTSSTAAKRNGDGSLPVTEKIESIRADINIVGMQLTFDSANPDVKVDNPALAPFIEPLKLISGSSYTVVLDDKNKVKFVEGTEKVVAKAENLNPTVAADFKSRFTPDRIKQEYEDNFGVIPTTLVREGEPWEQTTVSHLGSGQTLTFKKRYEYKGTAQKDGKTFDKIDVKSVEVAYAIDPDFPGPLKSPKSDLKVDSSSGHILFDREAGQIVETRHAVHIKGTLTLTINGQDLPSKLDLEMESTTTLEPAAK